MSKHSGSPEFQMALKDQIKLLLFLRWPALRSLRNRFRRAFPAVAGHRLEMPVLETPRLRLRSFDPRDLQEVAAWEEFAASGNGAVEAQEFLDHCFREYRERGIGPWAIHLKEQEALIGNCGFPDIVFANLCGEVSYYIAPGYRGRGLATEALLALFSIGFGEFGLARIQARCHPANVSSERVMQKAGMRFEGLVEPSASSDKTAAKQKLYSLRKGDVALKSDGSPTTSTKIGVSRSTQQER